MKHLLAPNTAHLAARLDRMPMLKLLVPFAAGIALCDLVALPAWFLATAFIATGMSAVLLRSGTCLAAMLLAAGFAAAQLRTGEPTAPRDVKTSYAIRIDGIPARRGATVSADATLAAWRDPVSGSWHPSGDRIVVRTDTLTALAADDEIVCYGYVRPFRGGSQSYRRLMRRRGYAGSLRLTERTVLARHAGRGERGGRLHLVCASRLARLELPPDAGAVVRAMTAGDRSALTPELRATYARSGFSHLLAVSGLHTGIVFALVNLLTGWLSLLRHGHLVRNLISTAAVWTFAAAADFPPSAVRAAAMCTMLQFALASASEYVAMNALAAAAFGMLLWNPAWLGDIGFRLSFAAVGAILAWGVPLCRRFRTRRRWLDAVIAAYLIGLTATAATAPLVSHTFGIVPLAGIVLNPAAILLAGAVVAGGTAWLLVPAGALAPVVAWVTGTAAEGIGALARLAAAVPGGVAEYTLSGGVTAAVYLLFAAATLLAWSIEPKKGVSLSK